MYEAMEDITSSYPELCSDSVKYVSMLRSVLERFPNLYCCYVSYLPECSPVKGQLCAPCAFRDRDNSIMTYDFGDEVNYLK